MTVDYDLVILGATLAAREAAAIAAQEGARVALVAAKTEFQSQIRWPLFIEVLTQITQQAGTDPIPFRSFIEKGEQLWQRCLQRVAMAETVIYPQWQLEGLRMQGVDVVLENGEFAPQPSLSFTTSNRRLTARSYLIAAGVQTQVPEIPGLSAVPCWTLETLPALRQLPARCVVLGRSPDAVAVTQALARLGVNVTLLTRGTQLLPMEEAGVSQFLEACLLADGVTVKSQVNIDRIDKTPEGLVQLQLQGLPALTTDHLLLGTRSKLALTPLNLDRVGVKQTPFRLLVDDHLRTTHPHIYACGPVLGRARNSSLERHEARVALHNALYFPRRPVAYRTIPYQLPTSPPLGRVGLTEKQARQWYGEAVEIYRLAVGASLQAHLSHSSSGFCQFLVHRNGTLLGVQYLGPHAGELVQSMALLMQQGGKIHQLADFSSLPYGLIDLLTQLAEQWQQHRWQPGRWRRDWAENWFNWRRSSRKPG